MMEFHVGTIIITFVKADYTYQSYPDKILGYDPVTVSVRDFKNALTNYQPIIIAMTHI